MIKVFILSEQKKVWVDLTYPGKKEQDPNWPNIIEDDEGGLVILKFEFYDPRTKEDPETPGEWIDIPDLNGAVSLLNSDQFDAEDCGEFLQNPRRIYTNVYCNEPTIPAENLTSEFGAGNPDRWERKPINFVSVRDEDGRWTLSGDYNIRMQLKSGDNTKVDINPDLNEDGEVIGTGSLQINSGTAERSGFFKWITTPRGGLHIAISDVGVKSMGHYLIRNGAGCDYGNDWLETSLFFCPFDTSDTDNFKVTRTLDYDADAYTGPIVNGFASKTYKIYPMPRTIGFYARYRGHKSEALGPHAFNFTYEWDGDTVYSLQGNLCENVSGDCASLIKYPGYCLCEWLGGGVGNNICCCGCLPGGPVSWLGSIDSIHQWISGNWWRSTGTFTFTSSGGTCYASGSWSSPTPDGADWVGYKHEGTILVGNYISSRTRKTTLHNIGVWYDRLPHDFTLGIPGDKTTSPTVRIASANVEIAQFWGDESKTQAAANLVAAGGSADNVLGGFNSFHIFRGENIYMVFADCDGQMERKPVFRSLPNHKPLDTLGSCAVGECYQIDATDNFALIWSKVQNSDFWTKYGKAGSALDGAYTYYGTEYQNTVPLAFGLVESRPGDLVGIIRAGGQIFYVWRKTQESFIVRQIGVQGDCPMEEVAYDTDTYDLGFGTPDSGSGRKRDKITINPILSSTPDPSCCAGADCGDIPALCSLDPGYPDEDATEELPAPIFVVGAREYAISASFRALNIESCKAAGYSTEKRNSM